MPFPGVAGAYCADALECSGLNVGTDDIVFKSSRSAGCVIACILHHGVLLVIAEEMELVTKISRQSARWRMTSTRRTWKASEIALAHAWRQESDGSLTVIRM